MTSTKADLIVASMLKIGALATGQNPAADEQQMVSKAVDYTLAALGQLGVVYVPNYDEIDDAFMDDIATIVGENIAPNMAAGRPSDPNVIQAAKDRLKKMQAPRPARRTLQFDSVLSHTGRRRY